MQRGSTKFTIPSPDVSWDVTVVRAEVAPALSTGLPVSRPPPTPRARGGAAVRVEEQGDTVHLFLSGELDLATAPLVDRNLVAAQGAGRTVVVDLEDVTFMDVCGLVVFLTAARRAGDCRGRFAIVNSSAAIRRVFEVTSTTFLLGVDAPAPVGADHVADRCGQMRDCIDYLNDPL